jgi:Acyl-coenzyme A:6-aminopenicillanic acid acyl-transferase
VPFQLAFRLALEQATSTDEVEQLLRATPLTVTNNLMVVDQEGVARVLELTPDGITTRSPDERGRLACTNHFLTRENRELRVSLTYLSSARRYSTAHKALRGRGPFTLEDARRTLDEVSVSILTQQSMIFLPAQDAMEVAFRERPPATRGEWVRIDVGALLGE